MKAFILAAGPGTRFYPITKEKPKCLVELKGKPLLGRQIEQISKAGINEFVIAIGAFANMVRSYVNKNFPTLNVEFVENGKYLETNYIYTVHLARELLNDDILFLHGDIVFETSTLKMLLESDFENAVLLQDKQPPPKKDFKGRLVNGLVKEIGVNLVDRNCFFLPPIYKISKKSMQRWLQEIAKFVAEGKTDIYAETVLNHISDEIKLHPLYFKEELCMEVDDANDLAIAEKIMEERKL